MATTTMHAWRRHAGGTEELNLNHHTDVERKPNNQRLLTTKIHLGWRDSI